MKSIAWFYQFVFVFITPVFWLHVITDEIWEQFTQDRTIGINKTFNYRVNYIQQTYIYSMPLLKIAKFMPVVLKLGIRTKAYAKRSVCVLYSRSMRYTGRFAIHEVLPALSELILQPKERKKKLHINLSKTLRLARDSR